METFFHEASGHGEKAKVLKYKPEMLHDGEKGGKEKLPEASENR
jgi:hypothetical protein